MEQERRSASRFSFTAQAELFEEQSQVRVVTRVADLSLYGCRLEMTNPFPDDTLVTLKISSGQESFQATVRIIYSTPNGGSGVEFMDVEPKELAVLERWLQQAEKP